MNHLDVDAQQQVIFSLGGVPGVGKSTMQEVLLKLYPDQVAFVRRMTDRPLRADERASTVWSVPQEQFAAMFRAGDVAAAFGANHHCYGVSLPEIFEILGQGTRWVGTISASVATALKPFRKLVPHFPDVVHIYLRVSDPEMLRRRLRNRGHASEAVETRMHEYFDQDEAWAALADHVVVNDDGRSVEDTVQEIAHLLKLPRRSLVPA